MQPFTGLYTQMVDLMCGELLIYYEMTEPEL